MTVETWRILISLWIAAGMTSASILYRRGHTGWRWMIVCSIAGPLSFAVVVDQIRFVEPDTHPTVVHASRHHRTGTPVVIAVAMSTADTETLHRALERLDAGDLSVVAAAPYEATGCAPIPHAGHAALAATEAARQALHDLDPTTAIVPGRLPDAAIHDAVDHHATTLVVPRCDRATLRRFRRSARRHPQMRLVVAGGRPQEAA